MIAFLDLLLCNAGPHKIMQEYIMIIIHKIILDKLEREAKLDASSITNILSTATSEMPLYNRQVARCCQKA